MNVLSLFDGISCGQQALERAGIKVDNYFASEVDKYAIKVTQTNYPNTIQLGNVLDVDVFELPVIDLLIGGSPCQSFSFAGKRKGMATKCEQDILTLDHYLQLKTDGFDFDGQSYLFWEYMRVLNDIRQVNPGVKFLLENVEMGERWEKVLSKAIGVNGIHINSALVSAQNRKRIYWTNIGVRPMGLFGYEESIIEQPKDKGILLKDILESEVDAKYYLSQQRIETMLKSERSVPYVDEETKKFNCLLAGYNKIPTDGQYVVHNTMPRSSTNGNGGTGHLSRTDGKTYCLDTGNTNAIEIFNNKRLNETLTLHKKSLKNGAMIDSYNKQIPFEKSVTIGTRVSASNNTHVFYTSRIRRLTPIECERLQTIKDNYTSCISDSQRYKCIGNGWTIDVITHILNYLQ